VVLLIVCIEGVDGSGKSTQAELLATRFRSEGKNVLLLSYPDYESDTGKKIKEYLHGTEPVEVKSLFKMYLDDIVKDEDKIKEADKKGIVILSRYYTSTIAYQCAQGYNYSEAKRKVLNSGLPVPDMMVYLGVSAQESMYRKMKGGFVLDRHERNVFLIEDVLKVYRREMEEEFPGNKKWIAINGSRGIEEIQKQIWEEVSKVAAKSESKAAGKKLRT